MALYSDLPIYKHGCDLLSLALDVQVQLPRVFKRSLGEKIHGKCVGQNDYKDESISRHSPRHRMRCVHSTRHADHQTSIKTNAEVKGDQQ